MGTAARLDLRFDADPDRPDYPAVTILVDGQDVLNKSRHGGWIGFDPADILGRDSPLLPTEPPRRVAVYRCNCGEPGCGVVAPVIEERDGLVTWSDFRDFTGVFVKPTVDEELEGGERLKFPSLVFEAAQYRAEVERASHDDSWETAAREVARLLREYLYEEATTLARVGYTLGWTSPGETSGMYQVSFHDEEGQTVVELSPQPGSPRDQAAEMADSLLRSPPQSWRVTARNRWPARTDSLS